MPSGRVRVAELASAMLWSAPLVGLLAIPASALLGIDLWRDPQQFAYVTGMALLGTWGVLIPNKAMEGRDLDPIIKRLIYLGVGVLLGVLGLVFGEWIHLGPLPNWSPGRLNPHVVEVVSRLDSPHDPIRFLSFFGLLYLANGWWKMTARDRRARFRIWPTLLATGLGAALFPFWPYSQPYGLAVVVLVAIVSQLVSPWSQAAAAYARYQKWNRRFA